MAKRVCVALLSRMSSRDPLSLKHSDCKMNITVCMVYYTLFRNVERNDNFGANFDSLT